ncbi:MAG: BamA/TamA family outer membrane protein [Sphingomicrobium sp.]
MPDLGIDWPDLKAADEADQPPPTEPAPPVGVSGPAKGAKAKAAVTDDGSSERRYIWSISGLDGLGDSAAMLATFRKQSALEEANRKAANVAQISRRSQADSDLLAEILRSQGYYDALVEPDIEGSGTALEVVLIAEPGAQYRFSAVELPGLDAAGAEDAAKLRAAFAVKEGDPVIAEDVIAAGEALTIALGEEGFAGAKAGEQDIVINHETHLASLTLPVTPGPIARFGAIRVTGEPPFDAAHVGIIARFARGDQFRRSRVDDLRRALLNTGLVANATVTVVPVDGGRTVDVAVALEPAPSHTIAGELGYGTGSGARLEASWTDRNFFNPEGALTLRGVAGTSEQLAAVQLRRSNFRMRDQTLNLQALASHANYDAYEARTIKLAGGIERQSNFIWQKKWTWTAGAELLATDERGAFDTSGVKDTRTFLIAALPATLGYDGSDNLLDPTRGFRLSGLLSPEISAHGGKFTYARTQIDTSVYHPVGDTIVLASRMRLGTIIGAGAFDIAPSRRFYAGGGGSVRGYGYQRLGPKDIDGDPTGGRGLAEFALEARIRLKQFGGNFGVVPFVDAGSLTDASLPDLTKFKFAVGLGVRYYSSFGPIRIDLGVPLNREKGDGPVAVAVSLGQAF